MIRIGCVLVVLAACGASSEHAVSPLPVAPGNAALLRSACPPASCAPAMCPGCPLVPAQPTAQPPPPTPEARDWYCHRYVNRKRARTTFCWVSRDVCQRERRGFYKQGKGKTTACVPRPLAYCTQVVQASAMARGFMCSQNNNDCERTRWRLLKGPFAVEHVTECREMRNIDSYQQPVPFPSGSLTTE